MDRLLSRESDVPARHAAHELNGRAPSSERGRDYPRAGRKDLLQELRAKSDPRALRYRCVLTAPADTPFLSENWPVLMSSLLDLVV